MDGLAFLSLEFPENAEPQPVYVVYGDEDFIKRRVLIALRRLVFGTGESDFGFSSHPADKADFAAICDELQTLPFLAKRRMVVVDQADPFVSLHRAALEKYVAQLDRPADRPAAGTGVLVLEVKSWPATTRLFKLLGEKSTVSCKAPVASKLPEWCITWVKTEYGKQLGQDAARLLVDLIGPELGQLDQELNKLSVYVGSAPRIQVEDVDRLVGSSRAANTFKILDAIAEKRLADALTILNRLFEQNEEPLKILGGLSWQLRHLVQAARLRQQGRSLSAALTEAGVPPFAIRGSEQQLRHLGQQRIDRLYDWILETDLGLKGSSQLPPRTLLERFVARLA